MDQYDKLKCKYVFPSFFSNGKLTVIVGNNLILNEMRMLQETVLDNINEALYDSRVKDIYLKTGNLYDKKDDLYKDFEDEFFDPSEIKITEEEKEKIEEEFSKYENNQIAERMKKIAMNAKETEKILVRKGYKECIRCSDLFMGAGEICIKCKNELAEERLKAIKRILERSPLISYRDILKEIEITESEYYRARDQLAEELTYIISDFIEEKNIIVSFNPEILNKIYPQNKNFNEITTTLEIENLIEHSLFETSFSFKGVYFSKLKISSLYLAQFLRVYNFLDGNLDLGKLKLFYNLKPLFIDRNLNLIEFGKSDKFIICQDIKSLYDNEILYIKIKYKYAKTIFITSEYIECLQKDEQILIKELDELKPNLRKSKFNAVYLIGFNYNQVQEYFLQTEKTSTLF